MKPLKKTPHIQISAKRRQTKSILYFSRFNPSLRGGGGSRRILQIMKLIRHHPFTLFSTWRRDGIQKQQNRKMKQEMRTLTENPASASEHFFKPPSRFHYGNQLRMIADIWASRLPQFPHARMVILDDPVYFPALVDSAAARGLTLLAVCHNLESLIIGNKAGHSVWPLLQSEIRLLRKCSLVVTISREEQVLLANLGINAFFLPYDPVEPVRRRMLAVRKKRKTTPKRGLLLLGNAGNPPTRQGMKKLSAWWRRQPETLRRNTLIIAGLNTDRAFKDKEQEDGIEIRGELTDVELDRLLTHIRGALCYQETGGGALTKINEFLTAGIPVLANFHAARSYHSLPGLIEFNDLNHLSEILSGPWTDRKQPEPPPKPDLFYLEQYIKEAVE